MAQPTQTINEIIERLDSIQEHIAEAIQDAAWIAAKEQQFANDLGLLLRSNCISAYIKEIGNLHQNLGESMRSTHLVCRAGTVACERAIPEPITLQIGSGGEKD